MRLLMLDPQKVGESFYARALQQKTGGGAPLDKGSALCVYLLSAESDGITGRLLSALWDPWPTLASHAKKLAETDIYTLRRIVPADRGPGLGLLVRFAIVGCGLIGHKRLRSLP